MPGISDRIRVLNLLVCRLKRGIEVNRTTKLLLQLIRPKLMKFADAITKAPGVGYVDFTHVLADLESQVVEQLLTNYQIGEIGYPLHYLFAMPNGNIRRHVGNYIAKLRKQWDKLDYSQGRTLQRGQRLKGQREDKFIYRDPGYEKTIHEDGMKKLAERANEAIDDGLTLKTSEFRVVRFCLDNSTEESRPLQQYMADLLEVNRTRITRIWVDSCKLLAAEIGHEEWQEASR